MFAEILFQISVLGLATLICSAIFVYGGSFITNLVWGFSLLNEGDMAGSLSHDEMSGFKMIQVFYAIGTFLLPPFIFLNILRIKPIAFLGLKRKSSLGKYLMVCLLWLVFFPFVSWIYELNAAIDFEAWGWIGSTAKEAAEKANNVTKQMLDVHSMGGLLVNLFVVALLPAIGEEVFFRGLIQKTVQGWARNGHVGVWVSAILFSFIHFQFDGFLPRMILGAFFGYLFLWSGNLKLTILAHFVNNGATIIAAYLYEQNISQLNPDENISYGLGLMSLALSLPLLYLFYRSTRVQSLKVLRKEGQVKWVEVYSTMNVYRASILHNRLIEEGYTAVIVNKNDSAYGTFGAIEVHVPDYEAQSVMARIKEWKP